MRSLKDALDSLNTFHQDYKASLSKTALLSSNCQSTFHFSNSKSQSELFSPFCDASTEFDSYEVNTCPNFVLYGSDGRQGPDMPSHTPAKNGSSAPLQDLDTIIRIKRDQARNEVRKLQKEDLYRTLGVNANASEQEINRAYKTLCLKHHPDKPGGDVEKFQMINQAYKVLSNKEMRGLYDQYGGDYIEAYFSAWY